MERMRLIEVNFGFKSYYAAPLSYEYCAELTVQYKGEDYYVMVCYNDYESEIVAVDSEELLDPWLNDELELEDMTETLLFEANDFTMEGYDEEEIPEAIEEAKAAIKDSKFYPAICFARVCADTFYSIDYESGNTDTDRSIELARKKIEDMGLIGADLNAMSVDEFPAVSYLPEEWR